MSSYINAWGEDVNAQPAMLHQGPARKALMQSTHDHPASIAQVDGANGLQRSNIRPSLAAARSASDRDVRRRRAQTGLTRGVEPATESARERTLDRHFAELQNDLTRVEIPQHGALLTVIQVAAEDLVNSHPTSSRLQEPEPEVPVCHNNLAHIEAPQPKKPVSALISQKVTRVKVPDRGLPASPRRKLSSSERSYLKSGVPKRKCQRVDPNLLFPEKYNDPRPGYICHALEESSASGGDDDVPLSPASESPPPQSFVDVEEAQDTFSVCQRAHEASTTNLHGWYPGKRVYGEQEVETEESRRQAKVRAADAALNTLFR